MTTQNADPTMTDLIARLKAGLPIETAISANAAGRAESAMAEAAAEIETLRRQLAAERALLDALQANGWELRRTLDYAHGHAAPIIGWAVRRWREDTQSLDCIAHALDDDPRAAIRKALTVQAKAAESAEPADLTSHAGHSSPVASQDQPDLQDKLAAAEKEAARAKAAKNELLEALRHHTGIGHGVMAIRALVERAENARKAALMEAITAVEAAEKVDREWLRNSVWHRINGEAADRIRRLL